MMLGDGGHCTGTAWFVCYQMWCWLLFVKLASQVELTLAWLLSNGRFGGCEKQSLLQFLLFDDLSSFSSPGMGFMWRRLCRTYNFPRKKGVVSNLVFGLYNLNYKETKKTRFIILLPTTHKKFSLESLRTKLLLNKTFFIETIWML